VSELVNGTYEEGYARGVEHTTRVLGWLYYGEDVEPDYSKELLVVYYVEGRRHLAVSWGSFDRFKKEILDEHPSYKLHAFRYLLEPDEWVKQDDQP
jgi:hypothetical protein